MLIGLGSYIFRYSVGTAKVRPANPLDAVGMVKRAASLGAEVLQFADNLPLDDLPDATLDEMRAIAEAAGMTLEAGTAAANEEQIENHVRIAARLNAKLLRLSLHTPSANPTREEARNIIANVLPKLREHNVSLAIENHFTMKSEIMLELIKDIDDPLVGVCLDTANSIAQQEWPEETIRLLGPYALSLHLKDFQMNMQPDGLGVNVRGTPLGEGNQNLGFIAEFLKNHSRDINIILEAWMPPADTVEETLRREEQWIKQSLAAAQILKQSRNRN